MPGQSCHCGRWLLKIIEESQELTGPTIGKGKRERKKERDQTAPNLSSTHLKMGVTRPDAGRCIKGKKKGRNKKGKGEGSEAAR